MLRLQGGQVESLWDEVLPARLRELPEDLARIDALLRDEALLAPIEAHWQREARGAGPLGSRSWPSDDSDADVRAADGLEAPLRLGLRDVDARGVGLAAYAPLLPDRDRRGRCRTSRRCGS